MQRQPVLTSRRTDPKPWAYARNSKDQLGPFNTPERAATRIDGMMMWYPRFEADPFLEAMRHDLETVTRKDREEDYAPQDRNLRGVAERWAWYLENGEHDVSWEPAHLEHASRVIGKLLGRRVDFRLAVG